MNKYTKETAPTIRYVVYDTKGKYMTAYNAENKSFTSKEAFKWAKMTANHCNGVVKVVRSDNTTYTIYEGYSKLKDKKH